MTLRDALDLPRLGRPTPLRHAGIDKRGKSLVLCLCDCGNEVAVPLAEIERFRSCGCFLSQPLSTLLVAIEHGFSERTVEALARRAAEVDRDIALDELIHRFRLAFFGGYASLARRIQQALKAVYAYQKEERRVA